MTPRRTALAAAALVTPALIAAMLVAPTAATADDGLMEPIGRYVADKTMPAIPEGEDQVRAESHAVLGDRLFSTNHTSLDIVDISDPENPELVRPIDLSEFGANGITSVAASDGRVAVAIPATDKTKPGTVVVMDTEGEVLAEVQVGALPDMLTFDNDGKRIVVANEGEPNDDYTVDPEGTVSIIDVKQLLSGKGNPVRTVRFVGVPRPSLNEYVRIFGPNASIAQDIEPEYVTIQGDRAFVSLQENNAIAEIDLRAARVVAVRGLEFKDHDSDGNGLDASDKDKKIAIENWPVRGMPMPDAIASFTTGGQTYIISANEGDSRDDWFAEEARIGDFFDEATGNPQPVTLGGETDTSADDRTVELSPGVIADIGSDWDEKKLGRLKVSAAPGTAGGDTDGDGDINVLQSFGTRSISIWSADGSLKWDSGDILEERTGQALPKDFNNNNDENKFDSRSDDKGPEPEGVAVGEIDGRTYAFVGLERVGGMAVFDVTNPASPAFVEYVTTRQFGTVSPTDGSTDSGPEVMSFVSAEDSPNGEPLVIMSNEVSGTIVIWSPKS